MRPLRTVRVRPALPPALSRLQELALNLWWCWHQDAIDLFERLDRDLWQQTGRNPVELLGNVPQDRLSELAEDDAYKAQLERVAGRLEDYMKARRTWFARQGARTLRGIGYFSLEFGIHESIPLYSGGMGLLAGDHIKSASDLGLPFAGVTLLYQEGYFRQYLNADGWQLERYLDNDFYNLPLRPVRGPDGAPLRIGVEFPGRTCWAQVWKLQVGRAPLYLLDANVSENRDADKQVTRRLYQGDVDMRIRQEILLGIGGVRALEALGFDATVCHMNEGHAAFLGIERVRSLMRAHGLSFHEAREVAAAGQVFTTHTPVPAGIDLFSPQLVDQYFGDQYAQLGLTRDEFLGLGRENPFDPNQNLSMAVLAIRLAEHVNGVSKLHGQVSRKMWRAVWPDVPIDEVPIGSITNGVHAEFWISGSEVEPLYDRYLGTAWREDPADPDSWQEVLQIPAEELWRAHERGRERLVAFARRRLRAQAEEQGQTPSQRVQAGESLDPQALTIGFARRFAAYKRAHLLFKDPERLAGILGDRARRVQIIVAGKAHPQDMQGRELIRQLVHEARRPELQGRIVFLEDYDISVARQLVQGVDLWLNMPRRPNEASGTSGMKVALNGGLNCSVLDGWWVEGYSPELGWAIGKGEEYEDQTLQDEVESRALYDLLEKDIVPAFYDRGADDVPRGWVGRMKASIANLAPRFNTHRMVQEYATRAYVPAAARWTELLADAARPARELAAWKRRMRDAWREVRVIGVDGRVPEEVGVGSPFEVTASVALGQLEPDEVRVEMFAGAVDAGGDIPSGAAVPMTPGKKKAPDGATVFSGTLVFDKSGNRGFTVRVLPSHPHLGPMPEPGLIRWA